MLHLRTLRMPDPNIPTPAQAFANAEKAAEHLANHVLTDPETQAWRLIEPRFSNYLNSDRDIAHWHKLAQERPPSAKLQPLYDIYCECVETEMHDALTLNWYKTEIPGQGASSATPSPGKPVCVGFGTSGVLAVFEQVRDQWVLRTAFIAGAGNPESVRERQGRAGSGPQPVRPNGMLARRHSDDRISRRDQEIRERREQAWTLEQRIYYNVFRPALQHVFRQQLTCVGPDGKIWRRDYALLKEALTRRSRISYENWRELRNRCRTNLFTGKA